MKKRLLISLILLLAITMAFVATGCNGVRTGKDYYFYTFEAMQGTFVKNNGKITFDKDSYAIYNNAGQVTDVGDFVSNGDTISFVPNKIGDANQVAATTSMYLYKSFFINTGAAISRVADTQFEDRSNLEGIYDMGIKLSDGKVYESLDGSDVDSSFVQKTGTYEINKNKDFITMYGDDGTVFCFLIFEYTDAFGYDVKALAPNFYSYKDPKVKSIQDTRIELGSRIFLNQSTAGGSANYNLSLISYPGKNSITSGATYSIVGVNNNATISGNTLTYTGIGTANIEYTYGNKKNTAMVYIVDMTLKTTLTDADKTFKVGDVEDYDDILAKLTDYSSFWFTYESVEISNTEKAEANNGSVTFKEAGNVEVTLVARYVLNYLDGSKQIVEKKQSIILIIDP